MQDTEEFAASLKSEIMNGLRTGLTEAESGRIMLALEQLIEVRIKQFTVNTFLNIDERLHRIEEKLWNP